jgi:hypothetical protein
MTALYTILTSYGFVIAADGLARDERTKQIVTDTAQKIFGINHNSRSLSFAFSGADALDDENGVTRVFLMREIKAIAEGLKSQRCRNLYGFCVRLSRAVQDILKKHRSAGYPFPVASVRPSIDGTTTVSRILIDGYMNGVASRAMIRFAHHNQVLQEASINVSEPTVGDAYWVGSRDVIAFLSRRDQRFAEFLIDGPLDFEKAIQQARNFILAQSSLAANGIDPETTATIGGRIHVAIITPDNGFNWASPELTPDPLLYA